MLLLFLLCSVTGSKALTYNGINTSTTVTLTTKVTGTSLTFTMKTRQSNAFLLSTVSKDFNVTIINGRLQFTSDYGAGRMQINDSEKINDGDQHLVLLITSAGNTTLYINNTKRVELLNSTLLNSTLMASINQLLIGRGDDTTPYYQGCFNGLSVGEVSVTLKNESHSGPVKTGCQSSIDSCSLSPCQNGGNCTDNFNDYKCHCADYYTGKNCTLTRNIDCTFKADLCNNGTCKALPSGKTANLSDIGKDFFECSCHTGYTGKLCDIDIDECAIQPCINNGSCTNEVGGYTCSCPTGFTGKNCEQLITTEDDDDNNLPLILGLVIAGVVIIILVLLICLYRYCKDKSGMEGTYSPNKEEQAGGNVEMHAIKKPKTERLI